MKEKAPKVLYIVIGCDADPDRANFISGISNKDLSWSGLSNGIPSVKDAVHGITDHDDRPPVFTWLIRVDEQIRYISGDYSWVLRKYRNLLSDLETSGDEIGWHPHFYKYDKNNDTWFQELDDIDWQCDMLESACKSFREVFREGPLSTRTGWVYHNNHTMKKISELGIKVDFSAVPGLRTRLKDNMKYPFNIYDWYVTPKNYYRPSTLDYRRPAAKGEGEIPLWELPNFVSNSRLWGLISGLQMSRKMKNSSQVIQAIKRPAYWVNLTGSVKLFAPLIKSLDQVLRHSGETRIFFVTYFHADELIKNNSQLYSRGNLILNLKSILELCDKRDIPYYFLRASDFPAKICD